MTTILSSGLCSPEKTKDSNGVGRGGIATYTVDEAAERLGIGRNAAYQAIKTGEIPSIRIGKRILVLAGPLNAMLGA